MPSSWARTCRSGRAVAPSRSRASSTVSDASSREELVWALHRATVANLLGARVLRLAEEEGLVAPDGAGSLGGVPHAEIFAMVG